MNHRPHDQNMIFLTTQGLSVFPTEDLACHMYKKAMLRAFKHPGQGQGNSFCTFVDSKSSANCLIKFVIGISLPRLNQDR